MVDVVKLAVSFRVEFVQVGTLYKMGERIGKDVIDAFPLAVFDLTLNVSVVLVGQLYRDKFTFLDLGLASAAVALVDDAGGTVDVNVVFLGVGVLLGTDHINLFEFMFRKGLFVSFHTNSLAMLNFKLKSETAIYNRNVKTK